MKKIFTNPKEVRKNDPFGWNCRKIGIYYNWMPIKQYKMPYMVWGQKAVAKRATQ